MLVSKRSLLCVVHLLMRLRVLAASFHKTPILWTDPPSVNDKTCRSAISETEVNCQRGMTSLVHVNSSMTSHQNASGCQYYIQKTTYSCLDKGADLCFKHVWRAAMTDECSRLWLTINQPAYGFTVGSEGDGCVSSFRYDPASGAFDAFRCRRESKRVVAPRSNVRQPREEAGKRSRSETARIDDEEEGSGDGGGYFSYWPGFATGFACCLVLLTLVLLLRRLVAAARERRRALKRDELRLYYAKPSQAWQMKLTDPPRHVSVRSHASPNIFTGGGGGEVIDDESTATYATVCRHDAGYQADDDDNNNEEGERSRDHASSPPPFISFLKIHGGDDDDDDEDSPPLVPPSYRLRLTAKQRQPLARNPSRFDRPPPPLHPRQHPPDTRTRAADPVQAEDSDSSDL